MAEYEKKNVSSGNTFFQSITNVGKLGYYPTDQQHCRKIAEMLRWPAGEVNVLEPSIGDGAALRTVISNADKSKLHTFGVELNVNIYGKLNEAKEEMRVDYLINADFLHGVKSVIISSGSVSQIHRMGMVTDADWNRNLSRRSLVI